MPNSKVFFTSLRVKRNCLEMEAVGCPRQSSPFRKRCPDNVKAKHLNSPFLFFHLSFQSSILI